MMIHYKVTSDEPERPRVPTDHWYDSSISLLPFNFSSDRPYTSLALTGSLLQKQCPASHLFYKDHRGNPTCYFGQWLVPLFEIQTVTISGKDNLFFLNKRLHSLVLMMVHSSPVICVCVCIYKYTYMNLNNMWMLFLLTICVCGNLGWNLCTPI